MAGARRAGYLITLHVVMVPVDLAVLRVQERVVRGGHDVPQQLIIDRWGRLWTHVAAAVPAADEAVFYDNSSAQHPYRIVAHLRDGHPLTTPAWPDWTPAPLRGLSD